MLQDAIYQCFQSIRKVIIFKHICHHLILYELLIHVIYTSTNTEKTRTNITNINLV